MEKVVFVKSSLLEKKKGQFYLISAIVLGSVIMGFVLISNYIQSESSERIEALEDEIKIESSMVLDYSLNQNQNFGQFYDTMTNFTDNYIKNYRSDYSIYFLYGSKTNMTLKGIQKEDKNILLISGENEEIITTTEGEFIGSLNPSGDEITVSIDGSEYDFILNTNKNFYFVISENISGNEYIVSG